MSERPIMDKDIGYVGHCMFERDVLTVAIEISSGLSFRDSSVIAGFTFC